MSCTRYIVATCSVEGKLNNCPRDSLPDMYVAVFWVLFEDDFFFMVLPAGEAGAVNRGSVAEPTPDAE